MRAYVSNRTLACFAYQSNKPSVIPPGFMEYKNFYNFLVMLLSSSFGKVSTPGQTQTGLGPRIYPFTTPGCCTAWTRCWQ